ncbi:hypothetical protein [Streptomyces antimycoticus]|uniref:hypothetical protein n=1 Tax=Streptomyces antimycoticus TaxID=68175 RepID=UPI0034056D06
MTSPAPLLDWRSPNHWSWTPKPCRYCGHDTNLRDSKRKPAHKVCAEQAIAQQNAEMANAYQTGHLTA